MTSGHSHTHVYYTILSGFPGHPNAVANTIGPGMVLVVVNPSTSGGLPTNYSVNISNSSYVYSNSFSQWVCNGHLHWSDQ